MSNSSEDRVSPRPLGMRQLRPLLPADEEVAAKLAGGGAGGTASDAPGGTQKRVAVACEACRRRKAKCNGARPKCSFCFVRGIGCVYAGGGGNGSGSGQQEAGEAHDVRALRRSLDELQTRHAAYRQLYQQLQYRPLEEAEGLFRRIRAGESPESILEHVRGGDLLLRLAGDEQPRVLPPGPDGAWA